MQLFAGAMPYASISDSSELRSTFTLHTRADRFIQVEGERVERTTAAAALNAFRTAQFFLLGLSVVTHSLITWRTVEIDADVIEALDLTTGKRLDVRIEASGGVREGSLELHAGHLSGAIDAMQTAMRWHIRFLQLFQRGEMLLTLPQWPLLAFTEDAYLCFFKCIEYLVMDRILGLKGQMQPKLLQRALDEVGVKVTAPASFAKSLVRTRGQKAAHMLKGYAEFSVAASEVYELKKFVDALVIATGRFEAQSARSARSRRGESVHEDRLS
ncbi:hypothetical protein ACFLSF_00325 [Candidatus Bipolaricaulota bacterium]